MNAIAKKDVKTSKGLKVKAGSTYSIYDFMAHNGQTLFRVFVSDNQSFVINEITLKRLFTI
jgi:hypothetical protein